MPVDLLDLLLPLVHEQELGRNVLESLGLSRLLRRSLVVVLLDREVPERDLVVRARRREARVLGRVPLDRRDGGRVPGEGGDGSWGGGLGSSTRRRLVPKHLRTSATKGNDNEPLEVPEVPNLDRSLISSRRQEVVRRPVPTDDVDIRLVRARDADDTLAILDTDVPDADALVGRATGEDGRLARTPLKVLDGVCVAEERLRGRREGRRGHGCEEDFGVDVAG